MKAAVSIRRPTTCSSSPRRTTSTSGSSGIPTVDGLVLILGELLRVVGVGARQVDRTGAERVGAAVQLGPGDLGGHLFRFLLAAPGARSHQLRPDHRLGMEALLVVRALLGDA